MIEEISRQMITARPGLVAMLDSSWWGTIEIILGGISIWLSFKQKEKDHTNSDWTLLGIWRWFLLVVKSSYCFYVVLDGVAIVVGKDFPHPLGAFGTVVILMIQADGLVFTGLLRKTALGEVPMKPFYSEKDLIRVEEGAGWPRGQ